MLFIMSNRKKPSKRLDINWCATPYKARWAFGPEEVPLWDFTRGFPVQAPYADVHIFDSEEDEERADLPFGETTFVRNDSWPGQEKYILDVLYNSTNWEVDAPKSGYPRLVRANYTEPIVEQWCNEVDVLNSLVRLLRNEPKFPGKRVLQDIANLNATVGPVTTREDNTLVRWLTLAHLVRAHFEARQSLNLGGFDAMYDDLLRWQHDYKDKPYAGLGLLIEDKFVSDRRQPKENPYQSIWVYALLACETYPATKEQSFMDMLQASLRDAISTIRVSRGRYFSRAWLEKWVRYQLADVWEAGVDIVECRGCHQLLFSRREGKIHHGKACQVLRREREVAAIKKTVSLAE